MEDTASGVLRSSKYSEETKELAAFCFHSISQRTLRRSRKGSLTPFTHALSSPKHSRGVAFLSS
ncbi:hypothetical protein D3C79_390040 [compost metagenome]